MGVSKLPLGRAEFFFGLFLSLFSILNYNRFSSNYIWFEREFYHLFKKKKFALVSFMVFEWCRSKDVKVAKFHFFAVHLSKYCTFRLCY